MKFSLKYFLATVILFLIEVIIATILKDWFFVRAYLGDVIVVMLIYTFVLSFFEVRNKNLLIIGIFAFAVTVEILQYLNIAERLNLTPGSWQHIVVGSSFSWWDIVCYGAGCILIWVWNVIKKDSSLHSE
ncbi:MAG: DUF2809 domain-containing protein [Cruoricaptor ignavus]|nr:DUF2809 domain-containing protein [Cruoricaptor ignavus]